MVTALLGLSSLPAAVFINFFFTSVLQIYSQSLTPEFLLRQRVSIFGGFFFFCDLTLNNPLFLTTHTNKSQSFDTQR